MNGNEFMRTKNSNLPRSLKFGEAELKEWFEDAGVAGSIHKILHDNQGWYMSFTNPDVLLADVLASMARMEEAPDPVPHANSSEVVKRKGASSSSKPKPKAKAPRKRALKEDGVADDPPQKKARTSGKNSASGPTVAAIDVDRDLMNVIAADEDANDELGLAVGVPMLDSRRVSSQHREPSYDGHRDDEVLDLEPRLIMGSEDPNKTGSSVTRVEEVLDDDAELHWR